MASKFVRITVLRNCFWAFFIVVLFSCTAFAEPWSGRVIGISDGDTITVLKDRQPVKIRLYGIDTPERKQAFGKKATDQIKKFVSGKSAEIREYDTDKYKRSVSIVIVNGQNVNRAMVESGYAWVYRKYCKEAFCQDWLQLEEHARNAQIGLWKDNNPEPPWDWRKSQNQSSTSKEIGGMYHGNTKSHALHSSECRYFNCKNCTAVFNSIQEALSVGYRPHNECVK